MQIEPIIDQATKLWMATSGRFGEYEIKWNPVNLMDETDTATARMNNAFAAEKEIANIVTMLGFGWMTEDDATDYLVEHNLVKNPTKDWLRGKVQEVLALKATRQLAGAFN
jgi:hypothetical protein